MLLIPFCSSRNGWKISYQSLNRYESPSYSTSDQISVHSGHFGLFRWISTGRHISADTESTDKCRKKISFSSFNGYYLNRASHRSSSYFRSFTSWMAHVLIPLQQVSTMSTVAEMNPSHGKGSCYCCFIFFFFFFLFVRWSFNSILNFLCLLFVFSFLFCEPSTWLGVGNDKETWQQVLGFVYVGSHLIYK